MVGWSAPNLENGSDDFLAFLPDYIHFELHGVVPGMSGRCKKSKSVPEPDLNSGGKDGPFASRDCRLEYRTRDVSGSESA